jgi:hypothetical protein
VCTRDRRNQGILCQYNNLLRPARSLAFYFHLGIEKLHYSSLDIIISWVKERKQPHESPCCLRWCRRSNSRSRWIFVSNQIFSPPIHILFTLYPSQSSITQEIYFYFYKATVSRLGREAEANLRASYYGPHAGKSQTTPQIPYSLPLTLSLDRAVNFLSCIYPLILHHTAGHHNKPSKDDHR